MHKDVYILSLSSQLQLIRVILTNIYTLHNVSAIIFISIILSNCAWIYLSFSVSVHFYVCVCLIFSMKKIGLWNYLEGWNPENDQPSSLLHVQRNMGISITNQTLISDISPVAVVRSFGGNQSAAIMGGAAIIRVPGIPTKMAQMWHILQNGSYGYNSLKYISMLYNEDTPI